jgi:hypothetical protein
MSYGRVAFMLCVALCARTVGAQQQSRARVTGSIESGAAAVQQPLVRSGAAFYVAPSGQLTARDFTIGADAVFATGTPIWQSFLGSGFVRSPAAKNVRLVGSAQLLKTSGLINTWHADAGAEWRNASPTTSGIARARVGRLRFNGQMWNDVDAGVSVFRTHGAMVLALDALFTDARRPGSMREQLGVGAPDSLSFRARTLDLSPRMIWERGRLRTDASLALRAVEQGLRGTSAGGQLSFTFSTNRGVSLFLGGTQRLPDVRSGIPSGRSALFGVRVSGSRLVARPVLQSTAGPSLLIVGERLLLDIGSASVTRATLRGDFTEWQPRDCVVRTAQQFDCGSAPTAGTWRVAIRLNNGAWQQPANLASAADDFGSVDGVLMTGGKP